MKRRELTLVLTPVLVFACTGPKPGDSTRLGDTGDSGPPDTAADTDTAAHTAEDSESGADSEDSSPPSPPCADGGWGAVSDPDAAVHVAPGGDDGAAGTAAAPLATVGAAVDRVVAAGGGEIALWPGTYEENVAIGPWEGETLDLALRVAGCSAEEVVLRAADDTVSGLFVGQTTGVELEGFTLEGGTHTLRVTQGSAVAATSMRIAAPVLSAIVIDGPDTVFHGLDLDVEAGDGSEDFVAGVVVDDASADFERLVVRGAVGVGVLVEGGVTSFVDTDILDTVPLADGTLGRALQVQWSAEVQVSDLEIEGAGDAAVFLIVASRVDLDLVRISGVAGGLTPDGELAGDGIVATGVYAGIAGDVDSFRVGLRDATVESWRSDVERPGIYLENVTADLNDNEADPGDGTSSLWADERSVLTGKDTVSIGSFDVAHVALDATAIVGGGG